MSKYTVTSIPLAPIPGIHGGTGTFQNPNWLVVPSSVPGSAKLQFVGQWVQVTTMLFQISDNVVPNWFGVAIPSGIADFSKANIFFHPMPAQAGYLDSDYATKSGLWPQLFYYMERLGYQMDGAARSQIIIMPFLKNSATNTGIFLTNWFEIVTDILTGLRAALGADDGSPLQLSQVVVSSFSIGIVYSSNFRAGASNLSAFLSEVWDFDGLFSSSPQLSRNLVSTAEYQAIKYDQDPSSGPASFHVPRPRWADYVDAPTTSMQTHSLIRDFMFLHAASISTVGTLIGTMDPGATSDPGSVPAPMSTSPPGNGGPDVAPPLTSSGQAPDGIPSPAVPGMGTIPDAGPIASAPFTMPSLTPPIPAPVAQPVPASNATPTPPQPAKPGAMPSPPYPTPSSAIPAPTGGAAVASPATHVDLHQDQCRCNCCCAVAAIATAVATTSTTAITAITAIATTRKQP
jgi:hypothetical protein